MINIRTLKYKITLLDSAGKLINLAPFQQEISWDENNGQLSGKVTLGLVNTKVGGSYLSSIAKLGAVIVLFANAGSGDVEFFRGRIRNWQLKDNVELTLVAYDALYELQKSKDNRFYKSGTTASAILNDIFKAWKVPVKTMAVPAVKLGKKAYRNEYLIDAINDVLSDVKKKGYGNYVVRAEGSSVAIVKEGSNKDVYIFEEEKNIQSTRDQVDIEDLITRVKVVGKSKVKYNSTGDSFEGEPVIEAVVDGKTEYGIIQDIYTRDQDESLADAKKSAQEILDDKGKPKRVTEIEAPDVPFIRKGDKVFIKSKTLNGNFIVLSAQHNANDKKMTMEVKPA